MATIFFGTKRRSRGQTIAFSKQEAFSDSRARGKRSKASVKEESKTRRREVTSFCKIMKKSVLKLICVGLGQSYLAPLTRHGYRISFNARFEKAMSVFGMGAREIICQYSTERHVRNDPKGRYQHLAAEDLEIKVGIHQVGPSCSIVSIDLARAYSCHESILFQVLLHHLCTNNRMVKCLNLSHFPLSSCYFY